MMTNNQTKRTRGEGEAVVTAVTMDAVNATVKNAIDGLVKNQLPGAINAAVDPFNQKFTAIENLIKGQQASPTTTTTEHKQQLTPEVQAQLLDEKRKRETLEASVAALQKENDASKQRADLSERESAIATALNEYTFVSDKARQSAAKLIGLELKRSEDGQLIAGDNLPVSAFIKDFLTVQNDHLLAGKDVAGSNGTKGALRTVNASVGMESISRNMTPETRTAILAQIKAALPQTPR